MWFIDGLCRGFDRRVILFMNWKSECNLSSVHCGKTLLMAIATRIVGLNDSDIIMS